MKKSAEDISIKESRLSLPEVIHEQEVDSCESNVSCLERIDDSGSDSDLPDLVVEKDTMALPLEEVLQGNRIVNISHFMKEMSQIEDHKNKCTLGKFILKSENRNGMYSTWTFQCNTCDKVKKITSHDSNYSDDINDAVVWGALSVGIGHSQVEELLSVMDIPSISGEKFRKHESSIEQAWEKYLTEKLRKAGEEEKKIAEENGHYCNGVPYITVVGDGGWGKRTYGHGYNSSTGVAVIIGKETQKILYLGVKNKYCSICSLAKSKGKDIPTHVCYKNHTGSSTKMERDIICEGFNSSIEIHGVMYKHYTGDGDAAVIAAIQQTCNYGRYVSKVECANHATRAFSERLHKIASNTTYPLEGRKLLLETNEVNKISRLERLVKGIRTAIKESAKVQGKAAIDILRADLRNAPDHVFGSHDKCRSDFCLRKQAGEKNILSEMEKAGLLQPIRILIATLEKKADKLVTNSNTNSAERYMALNAKFTGGKRINFGKRGSYYRRCYGAAIAHTGGPGWHTSPWKMMHGRSPGNRMKGLCKQREEKRSKRKLIYQENGAPKKKRRTGAPDEHYGAEDLMPEPDVTEDELTNRCDQVLLKLKEEVNTKIKRDGIEISTRGQHDNAKWHEYRMNRLTASNFGTVILRRDYTSCHNLVRNLLFSRDLNTLAVAYGRVHEPVAIAKYSSATGVDVVPCGLFVSDDESFLAASPDGLVDHDGLVEVKCLPSVKDNKLIDLALNKKSSLCLELKNGSLHLKKTHKYYYQVQGQLNITGRNYCDFVVATENDFFVERIGKDENLWKNTMLPKLRKFYIQCVLPEIADSRIKRSLKVRDPLYITQAQEELRKKKLS